MDTFRTIILRGNIRNSEDIRSPNYAASNLSLIPNSALTDAAPVSFFIDFIVDKYRMKYSRAVNIGILCDAKKKRKIMSESLHVNDNIIVERKMM